MLDHLKLLRLKSIVIVLYQFNLELWNCDPVALGNLVAIGNNKKDKVGLKSVI
jgi:hypothetical protein